MSLDAKPQPRLAVFAATSGHSGVDRIVTNLVDQWAAWGLEVDLLQVRRHGPTLVHLPPRVRRIDLGTAHVNSALPALVRYLRRERPSAMLCDKDRVNRLSIVARRMAGSPTRLCVRLGTAVSVNLAERGRLERFAQRLSMRYLYPMADQVIVPAQSVKLDLLRFSGLADDHVEVIRSPILTPAIASLAAQPAPHAWLEDDASPVIIGIGELSYRKQFETLVQAFAQVRRERPCRLIILGRGRRREALMRLADDLAVSRDIALPGFQANPYAWLSRARVFVLSSLWEGLPVALIEALGLNVPTVATHCPGGNAEVLTDNCCGTLVPIQNPSAMAAAIKHWLDTHGRPEAFAAMVAPYRVEVSAAAYLCALGFTLTARS